jgi:hypothetical protein
LESVSFTPALRVGGSEIDRVEPVAVLVARRRRERADVPRGDPVDGVGIVRYPDAASGQLLPESYRPGAGDPRGLPQVGDALGQLVRPVHRRLPQSLPVSRVEGGENLPAPTVEHGQRRAVPFGRFVAGRNRRGARLLDPPRQGVQRADATNRQAEADGEAARSSDPDPQAGEGAGTEADREEVYLAPAAGRGGSRLYLGQQPGRMQRPAPRREPQLRLVQDLAVAPGAGDGIGRRGIEADDDQRRAIP